jgi:drug/metabolite transporter (DMT)-like permease
MNLRSIVAPEKITARRAIVEVLLCVLFWGASFSSMKIAVKEVSPLLAVWLRIALAMFVAVPAAALRGEFRPPSRGEAVRLAALGFLGIAFHLNLQFAGMRDAGAANSNWMLAASPSVIAALGWIFLRERLNMTAIAGLAASMVGVLLVIGGGTKELGGFSPHGTGDLLIALSAVNWAVFHLLSRRMLRGQSQAFSILWMNVFALVVQSFVVFALYPQNFSGLLRVTAGGWYSIIFLGCVCSGLCYILWYDGLAALTAARVSAFQFLQPVFGATAAYFLVGERFTFWIYIGGVLILAGVWMVNNGKD